MWKSFWGNQGQRKYEAVGHTMRSWSCSHWKKLRYCEWMLKYATHPLSRSHPTRVKLWGLKAQWWHEHHWASVGVITVTAEEHWSSINVQIRSLSEVQNAEPLQTRFRCHKTTIITPLTGWASNLFTSSNLNPALRQDHYLLLTPGDKTESWMTGRTTLTIAWSRNNNIQSEECMNCKPKL